ncbi:uncharacterized protein LOC122036992 isoform X1 [Zingiber officinale]|uniref:uncharacterized protein LOC122036992 isoform X1 n=1 Tax=Zingiber officinale TaxID=94328 RepID=UPI001C4BB7DF|nr:uncharacterized protein LOC122036992 isoform X1 [Zingiber officinale]
MGSRNEKGNDEPWKERERATRAWHVALFGLVGVTATGLLAGQLRKTTEWVYTQLSRLRSTSTWSNSTSSSRHEGSRQEAWKRYYRIRMQEEYEDERERVAGELRKTAEWVYTQLSRLRFTSTWSNSTSSSSHEGSKQEAWKRYYRRMQEEYDDERERVERIRQMQSVFNRGRNKHKTYRSWTDNDPGKYQYIPREDWYYETSTSRSDHKSSYKSTPNYRGHYTMSHHYTVLGLDRTRAEPYTDAEVKSAFRTKAMEHHPDQNQENRVAAEAKFKEIMISYEAIKLERENQKC